MNHSFTSQTAVLVFANSAKEEARHKPIPKADILFDALTARTLETVKKTGLRYFHISETRQVGTTFGERFANAIQTIFDRGFENVITIGNDSPQLRPHHITEAARRLQNKAFVLGPSTDGGFYLMGLQKAQFEARPFSQLEWQTSRLANQLLHLVSDTCEVFHLQTLFDIDTVADVKSVVAFTFTISGDILQILLSVLVKGDKRTHLTINSTESLYFSLLHNKGSPVLLQSA